MVRNLLLGACVIAASVGATITIAASAAGAEEFVAEAPAAVAAIKIDEHLGAQVPLDLAFRDQDGKDVTLGDLVRGDLPVVLTFNYSNCPMLCSMQLNGLVDGLISLSTGESGLRAGEQFRIVTVILEPKEEPERAAKTREAYLAKAGNAVAADGWTFLVAKAHDDDAAIRALADTVGFRYVYQPDSGEFAHPAALIYLSPTGTVTRYVNGISYARDDLFDSTVKAGTASPAAAVGFLQRCFHYEPKAGHARAGFTMMRVGAGAFAALVLGVLLFVHLRKSRS